MSEKKTDDKKLRDLHDRLWSAGNALEELQGRFLRAAGWIHSSEHPDCRWRWSKRINDKYYCVDTQNAILLEEFISADILEPEVSEHE